MNAKPMSERGNRHPVWLCTLLVGLALGQAVAAGSRTERAATVASYPDGRPAPIWRLEARDQGVVFRHGSGPGGCDALGARDVWVWQHGGTYYLHYDGAGAKGWLTCLATSEDLVHWAAKGPVLDLGKAGEDDSASASYGVTFFDGRHWHMFYLGTPHVTPAPDLIPGFPYLTMKASAETPSGPWLKQPAVTPFRTKAGTYYSATASPGHVIRQGDEYLMFFSASTDRPILRTLSLARTKDLNGPWTIAPEPIVPPEEQVENSSLFYDDESKTWFLFTDHVGLEHGLEYTDAIWVYWTKDLSRWNRDHKAVVLDGANCQWSKHIIGLPSVVKAGNRLAIFYDGNAAAQMPRGVKSHMDRDVGLAWLDLPLTPPAEVAGKPVTLLPAAEERFPNLASHSTLPQGPGLAARFKADSGIATDPDVIFADNFETGALGARWDEMGAGHGKALSFAPAGGGACGERCLKVEARLGVNEGDGLTKWFEPTPQVFVRFYVRFDPGCDYVHHFVTLRANKGLHGRDKWSGFGSAGLRPVGDERFSTALEPWGNWGRWPAPGKWNFYSYWHEMQASPDGKYWGNSFAPEPQAVIAKDRWMCAEFMLKHNTPGQPDGEQAFWIDGRLLGHWHGINWRKSGTLMANALTLESYVTDRWTKNPTNTVYFDNLVIAREYIGPAGAE